MLNILAIDKILKILSTLVFRAPRKHHDPPNISEWYGWYRPVTSHSRTQQIVNTENDLYDELQTLALTHWGRVTHICVSKLTIIGSDNGLSPDRRQAIIWTNAGILLIGPLGTNFSEILIEILTFSFKKMRLKVSSAKRRPFCLGLNVLTRCHTGFNKGHYRYNLRDDSMV